MILNNEEKKSLVNNLSWMITEKKNRYDDQKGNLEEGSQGDYSSELKQAINLLDNIKKTDTIETTGCHRGVNAVNCREFDCSQNRSGICLAANITLESIGSGIVGRLKCVQAEEKEEEEGEKK